MDYIISDTHFDHANIIRYCDRPFDDVEDMNEALVANWNRVVDPGDDVLFLGDLTMEGDFAAFQRWIGRLDGHIHFVVGDHDVSVMDLKAADRYEYLQFQHRGIPVYAVHDPEDAPRNWKGWVFHGHHHNNWPEQFPLVNPEARRLNASVELIEYAPLPMSTVVELLQEFRTLTQLSDRE